MPEETILRCDAPDCNEVGQYVTIIIDGKSCDVILGPDHLEPLKTIAGWGRPTRNGRPTVTRTRRRGTDEARLLRLLNADRDTGAANDPRTEGDPEERVRNPRATP